MAQSTGFDTVVSPVSAPARLCVESLQHLAVAVLRRPRAWAAGLLFRVRSLACHWQRPLVRPDRSAAQRSVPEAGMAGDSIYRETDRVDASIMRLATRACAICQPLPQGHVASSRQTSH